ncbi:hypothetical protein P4O66_009595, partial [Electrophorus voltai]
MRSYRNFWVDSLSLTLHISISSTSLNQQICDICSVLRTFLQNHLYCKLEKCKFHLLAFWVTSWTPAYESRVIRWRWRSSPLLLLLMQIRNLLQFMLTNMEVIVMGHICKFFFRMWSASENPEHLSLGQGHMSL